MLNPKEHDDTREDIEKIASRMMYLLKHPEISEYTKVDTLKTLIKFIEPDRLSILSFAIDMTPTPEKIAENKKGKL